VHGRWSPDGRNGAKRSHRRVQEEICKRDVRTSLTCPRARGRAWRPGRTATGAAGLGPTGRASRPSPWRPAAAHARANAVIAESLNLGVCRWRPVDGLPPIRPRWVAGGSSEGVLGHLWHAIGRLSRARRKRGGHRRAPTAKRPPSSFSGVAPTEGPPPPPTRALRASQVEAFTRPLSRDSRVRVKSLALKVRSSIPTACATRSRPDASYSTVGVGDQLSFRLIQDKPIRCLTGRVFARNGRSLCRMGPESTRPRPSKRLRKPGRRRRQNVGLRSDMEVCHQLGVRLRKTETRSFLAAPQQSMT